MGLKYNLNGDAVASNPRPDKTKRTFDDGTGNAALDGYTTVARAPVVTSGPCDPVDPAEAERVEKFNDEYGDSLSSTPWLGWGW